MINPKTELQEAVHRLQLPELEERILIIIALDPHGMTHSAAPSFLASQTSESTNRCSEAISSLFARKLLVQLSPGGDRFTADYEYLKISSESKQRLYDKARPFENQGEPHSQKAMDGLNDLFLNAQSTLYIGIEVTPPEIFQKLGERAKLGHKTVFIMPKRDAVAQNRRKHYDESLKRWVEYFDDADGHVRNNVEIRTTVIEMSFLFTSALSQDVARFDAYKLGSSTRTGDILVARRGSSLYNLLDYMYREVYGRSSPLFQIWPKRWIWEKIKSYYIMAVIALAISALVHFAASNSVVLFCGGIVANLAASYLYLWLEGRRQPVELFHE